MGALRADLLPVPCHYTLHAVTVLCVLDETSLWKKVQSSHWLLQCQGQNCFHVEGALPLDGTLASYYRIPAIVVAGSFSLQIMSQKGHLLCLSHGNWQVKSVNCVVPDHREHKAPFLVWLVICRLFFLILVDSRLPDWELG